MPMVSNRPRRLSPLIFAFLSCLTVGRAFAEDTGFDEAPFALGGESCGRYLSEVGANQSLQDLYDAWLAGYMKVVTDQMPGGRPYAPDTEIASASAWVKNYCLLRASDSYLTAAVRLIEARERNPSGAMLSRPAPGQFAAD
jgi:hypothetical protein